MKRIVLLIALISVGYFIYIYSSLPTNIRPTHSEKILRVEKLFNKVLSNPVSAQEAKPVFKGSMIDTCEKLGLDPNDSSDINNGLGTTTECLNNFETLASEQCFKQLTDFENKVYISWDVLKVDYLAFSTCVMDIVSTASFIHREKSAHPDKFILISDSKVTIKNIMDKVSSIPVSTQEVKWAFKNAEINICEVNGVDTINGFGTTTECINNFEMLASEKCFDELVDFEDKNYTSKLTLRADFIAYDRCVTNIIMGESKKDSRFLPTVKRWLRFFKLL